MSGSHLCQDDDGLYPNPDDRTIFIECIDGKQNFLRCPLSLDGSSYKIFDGRQCVEPIYSPSFDASFRCPKDSGVFTNPSDFEGYTYYECDNWVAIKKACPSLPERMMFDGQNCVTQNHHSGARVKRQVVDYKCPTYDGIYLSTTDIRTWYECVGGVPVRLYTCESGQTLDITAKICRGTTVRDQPVVVRKPETVIVRERPAVADLRIPLRPEHIRDTNYRPSTYYTGLNHRIVGRCEIQDGRTNSVYVWVLNAALNRWEAQSNGLRQALPLVNG